jgi:glycogen debranching enzyme
VVDEGHPDWPALRRYHLFAFRNRPHEYHNGGVWPIWLGWLALALGHAGRDAALARLRALADAALAARPGFDFEEYLHGLTGEPGGTARMAYSATGLVMLRAAGTDAARRLFAPTEDA